MNQIEEKVEIIDIQLLNPHSKNKEIYGQEDIIELAEQIKKSGWIKPIVVNQNNIIISGHRRILACIYLGIKEVPIIRKKFKDENEELEMLLLENQYREKTLYQKTKEAEIWEEIEREKAKKRQLKGDTLGSTEPKGKVSDIVAEKFDISGSTYKRSRVVVKKINELRNKGKEIDVDFLITVLNESASGAKDLAESNKLDEISEDVKNKVIKGELPVKQAVREIRESLGIINSSTPQKHFNNLESKKIETKICKQCNQEKSTYEFYEGKTICKDCHNENRNKKRIPKDVYGNEIKINKEKIKGIDIETVLQDVKNTNKDINIIDYDAIAMEFTCNIDMFIQNINKYIDMPDIYKLNEIDKNNRGKFLKSINNIEETINKIKNYLI